MRATLKNFVFWHFFEKNKKTFQKLKQFYFRFANVFEKNHFVSKKFYFCFGNTFNFVCKLKHFRFKNNFTFVSKAHLFRKYFINQNIYVSKNFCFGNTSTFLSKTLRKTIEKNLISFVAMAHVCHPPMRANVST